VSSATLVSKLEGNRASFFLNFPAGRKNIKTEVMRAAEHLSNLRRDDGFVYFQDGPESGIKSFTVFFFGDDLEKLDDTILSANLQIIDVRNPFNPIFLSTLDLPLDNINDIEVVDNLALIAAGETGLQVVNVEDPGHPQKVGSLLVPGTVNGIDVKGQFAYLAAGLEGLVIVDLSTPNIFEIGSVDTFGIANRVKVIGDLAFVSGGAINLIATPESGLTIIDIHDPSNPTVIGRLDTTPERRDHRAGGSFDCEVVGTLAFLTTDIVDQEGKFVKALLQVVDISDPTNPEIIANANLPERVFEVTHLEDYVIVADHSSGVRVIPIPFTNVVDIHPAKGEQDVSPDTEITITFSDQVNPDSVINPVSGESLDTITIVDDNIVPNMVSGTFRFEGHHVIFTPDLPLMPATTYMISISDQVVDLIGMPMVSPFVSWFSTMRNPDAVRPSIFDIETTFGGIEGGTEIIIKGENFGRDATVTIGGFAAKEVRISEDGTQITCRTPTNNSGPATIAVINPGGLSDTLLGGFTYLDPVEVSFVTPEAADCIGINVESAIVTAVPNQGVFFDAEFTKSSSQHTHTAINTHDFSQMMTEFVIGEVLSVFIQGPHRVVRRTIPDHGQKRRILLLLHKLEGFSNDHLGRVPFEGLESAIAAHQGIQIEVVGHGQPHIETVMARVVLIVTQNGDAITAHPIEMPFAEMGRAVASLLQGLGQSLLLQAQPFPMRGYAGPIVRATG